MVSWRRGEVRVHALVLWKLRVKVYGFYTHELEALVHDGRPYLVHRELYAEE